MGFGIDDRVVIAQLIRVARISLMKQRREDVEISGAAAAVFAKSPESMTAIEFVAEIRAPSSTRHIDMEASTSRRMPCFVTS
jgi:hypothetical protein